MTAACRISIVLGLWVPVAALAEPAFVNDLPNGDVYGCETCHSATPSVNWFGADVALAYNDDEPAVYWDRIYGLDSDGDGLTNGEELGDPCGEWLEDMEAGANPSHPGEEASLRDAADLVRCDITDTDDTPAKRSCLYSTTGPREGAWWLSVAALLAVGRRR
jgi:MYXO-CTERM domain-containing protein